MGIVSAIEKFFGAIRALFGFLDRKQLMDAGEAKATVKAVKAKDEKVKKARAARTDPDTLKRVRNKRYRD